MAVSQFRKSWSGLDKLSAKPWLIKRVGASAYFTIWDPLLRIKFGDDHEQISAAWIWHRIHRVARSRTKLLGLNSYGYLDQGCHTLMQRMIDRLSGSENFRLILNGKASKISIKNRKTEGVILEDGKSISADAVISTCAIPTFIKMVDSLGDYGARLASITYINVVCALFELDRPYSNHFWLNVNDPRMSFNGIVETTNLNPRPDLKGRSLIYVPYYMSSQNPRWGWTDESFLNEYTEALKIINPQFKEDWIVRRHIFRDANAQALCKVGFSEIMPAMGTPIRGLYITDSSQYYPEDRTLSASVKLGSSVAELLTQDLDCSKRLSTHL